MNADVLLNELNELRKEIKSEVTEDVSFFHNKFNEFNNTGA